VRKMDRLKIRLISPLLKLKGKSPLEMAQYAFSHTKFYNNFYKSNPLENFEDLPVVTKYDFTGISPYDLLSDEFKDKVILYGETSGSSGSPTSAFFTKNDFEGLISLSLLSPFASEMKKTAKQNRTAINGLTFGFTIAGFSFGAILQKAGFLVAQLGSRSTIATPERMARTIVKLKPSAISATPLDFMSWLKIIKKDYPDDYLEVVENLKFLLSTAEPCALSRQHQIEKFFDITHINTYASVDGLVSLQCPCGEMHLIDNLLEVELFNGNMEPIGPYGTGRLCFTNLVRKSTPMVRFLLDDLVTIKKTDCSYGYRKSIWPHGRYELSVDINNQTLGNLDFEDIIYRYGLFMNYNVEIYHDEVNIILEEYDENAINSCDISELKNEISRITGIGCSVSLVPLGELTAYRKVRDAKSIIKVADRRKESRQEMPSTL
jgi:phenylacetate-CoA ligase